MGARNKKMFRDGQMRAALDHEAQARVAHQRNAAWKGLHAPAGFARVERYQTADPTLSLATVQDGRPVYDFAAAPSLFVEEDLRQEKHMVEHRSAIEAACTDAEAAARAAINRAHELRDMLSSAQSEQERASAERLRTSAEAEAAAKCARDCEALAVEARRHRTVHSQNVAALRPRATGNQSSPQPSA